MTISQSFETVLANIKVDNSEKVSTRYKEITKKLNKISLIFYILELLK